MPLHSPAPLFLGSGALSGSVISAPISLFTLQVPHSNAARTSARRVIDAVSCMWPSNSYRDWNQWWDIECTVAGGTGCWQLVSCSSTAFFLLISQMIWATCAADSSGAAAIYVHKSITIENDKKTLLILETSKIVLEFCCPALPGAFCGSSQSLTAETDGNDQREAWGHVTKVACQIGGYTACIWVIWGAKTPPHATV